MAGRKKALLGTKFRFFIVWALSASIVLNIFLIHGIYNRSLVKQVPDGDTLQLNDGRRIRLRGIDAPEKGRCLSDESALRLAELTLGRHISIKNAITDTYGRIVADVFITDPIIWFSPVYANRKMISSGLVSYSSTGTEYDAGNLSAYREIKDKKLGIFSSRCRQKDPVDDCDIKANIRSGKKFYYLPDCLYYDQVVVDQSFGDRWFCTEQQAQDAGFILSSNCSITGKNN